MALSRYIDHVLIYLLSSVSSFATKNIFLSKFGIFFKQKMSSGNVFLVYQLTDGCRSCLVAAAAVMKLSKTFILRKCPWLNLFGRNKNHVLQSRPHGHDWSIDIERWLVQSCRGVTKNAGLWCWLFAFRRHGRAFRTQSYIWCSSSQVSSLKNSKSYVWYAYDGCTTWKGTT